MIVYIVRKEERTGVELEWREGDEEGAKCKGKKPKKSLGVRVSSLCTPGYYSTAEASLYFYIFYTVTITRTQSTGTRVTRQSFAMPKYPYRTCTSTPIFKN